MLFRPEAIESRRPRLYGDVFLTQPFSYTALAFLVVFIVAFIMAFIGFGSYSRTETVAGQLVASKGIVRIQTPVFGYVSLMLVREGDYVETGAPIFTVYAARSLIGGETVEDIGLKSLSIKRSGLEKEAIFERKRYENEFAQTKSELKSKKSEIKSLDVRIGLQNQISDAEKIGYENASVLAKKEYISTLEVSRRHSNWLAARLAVNTLQQNANAVKSQIEQLRIRLEQLPLNYGQFLADLDIQRSDLSRLAAELEGKKALTIKAPIAGNVTGILINLGQSVQPGRDLLSILPSGSHLLAELYVPSRASGFLETGQGVALMYDAFPFQQFGTFEAKIELITDTILVASEVDAPQSVVEPVYRVRAQLGEEILKIRGREFPLQPGMRFSANIILEDRIILDWLLDPFRSFEALS